VGHHHVDRVVFAKEVEHAHHRRVGDLRQRPTFLEEAFQAQEINVNSPEMVV